MMNFELLNGKAVRHEKFGKGIIRGVAPAGPLAGHLKVDFPGAVKKFNYPDCFSGYLLVEDSSLQDLLVQLADKSVEDQNQTNKAKLDRAVADLAAKQAQIAAQKGKRNTKIGKVLQVGDEFSTHHDALNECFGYRYTNYQHPYKKLEDAPVSVWFYTPSVLKNGKLVSSSGNKWINEENAGVIVEHNMKGDGKASDGRQRVTFRKDPVTGNYVFVGVYEYDPLNSDGHSVNTYRKVGDIYDCGTLSIPVFKNVLRQTA